MKNLFYILSFLLLLSGCQSFQGVPKSEHREPANEFCPPELDFDLDDLKNLEAHPLDPNGRIRSAQKVDLSKLRGKVVVLRLMGTWCPYCKSDLLEISQRFLKQKESSEVELVLIANSSRRETEASVSAFRSKGSMQWGLHPDQFHFWFVGSSENPELTGVQRLAQTTDKNGALLFPEYKGVPYGLVFDKKGKLRFRGLFTSSPESISAHYSSIEALVKDCKL